VTKLKAKQKRLTTEVNTLRLNAPTFNQLVAGEFHAVSQYTDRSAVVRMMNRLNEQLRVAQNSTAVEKRKSVLQVAHATARLYAHQVAHATHSKYLKFKLGRLNQRVDSVKKDIQRLKANRALPSQSKLLSPDRYDHLLNDEEKLKKSGSSAQHFTVQTDSWLNPEPVGTPVEVTPTMRFNMKVALRKQFQDIAGMGAKPKGDDADKPDGESADKPEGDSEVRDLGESDHA